MAAVDLEVFLLACKSGVSGTVANTSKSVVVDSGALTTMA